MNILILKKNLAHKKNIVGDGGRTHKGFQIKHKYKRRVDQGAKWYAVRDLLI